MDAGEAATECDAVMESVERAVICSSVPPDDPHALLGRGHVLLEDVPGTGKTLTARSIATALGLSFSRIQFTPDLLPADVTGSRVFDDRSDEFDFRPGPVFSNVLMADEINRAPPKSQSALLEAMEEQVTVGGKLASCPTPSSSLRRRIRSKGGPSSSWRPRWTDSW